MKGYLLTAAFSLTFFTGVNSLAGTIAQLDAIPESAWTQYPALILFIFALFGLLKLAKDYIQKRDDAWQNFLRERDLNHDQALDRLAGSVEGMSRNTVAALAQQNALLLVIYHSMGKDRSLQPEEVERIVNQVKAAFPVV